MDINRYSTKNKLNSKHLISIENFDEQDIFEVLLLARKIKMQSKAREKFLPLKDSTVAFMISSENSLTKIPFEITVNQLGGHTLYLSPGDKIFTQGLSFNEAIRVLKSFGIKGLIAKLNRETNLNELYKNSDLPIISVKSGFENPCQILADIFTIWEKKYKLNGIKLAISGNFKDLNESTLSAYAKVGFSIRIACPDSLTPKRESIEKAEQYDEVKITRDVKAALNGADVVSSKFDGTEPLTEEDAETLANYKITPELMQLADPYAVYMHSLPINHEKDVSEEILNSDKSMVFVQTENLIYIQKALICLLFR